MLIKNSKSTHPIVLIFLLLLTLSLILSCTAIANRPVATKNISNDGLISLEDVATDNSTLRNCIKVSTQITEYIH